MHPPRTPRPLRRWAPTAVLGVVGGLALALSCAGIASAAPDPGGGPGTRAFQRVTVANETDHAIRLARIDGGAQLDRWPGIGATLQPGQSHEWDIRDGDGEQHNRAVYDVLDPGGNRVG